MRFKTASSLAWLAPVRSMWIALGVALSSALLHPPARAANEARLEETANCIALMQTTADDLARLVEFGLGQRHDATPAGVSSATNPSRSRMVELRA